MPLKVLARENPRRLALVGEDHALLFQHVPTTSESAPSNSYANVIAPRCIVQFGSNDSLDLTGYRVLGKGHGTLGLITLEGEAFLCVITSASRIATIRPGETVNRINAVEFYCLSRPDYNSGPEYEMRSMQRMSADDSEHEAAYDFRETAALNPFQSLKKLLDDGSFYYSVDFNLTNRLQDRTGDAASFDIENFDQDFLWNSYMIGPLLQFRGRLDERERQSLDSSRLLTSVIRGFVQSLTIPASSPLLRQPRSNLPSEVTLISRLSSRRAGTRFNSRGIDDDGNVSNFVETETILYIPSAMCFSYTQIRGSVPVFWEQQPGLIPGQQKIEVTRSTGATQPAFDRHFEHLELDYGAVHVVNLLSASKQGEVDLTQRFRHHVARSPLRQDRQNGASSEHHLLRTTEFDFHAETRGPAGYESAALIRHEIEESADGFAYFLAEDHSGNEKRTISMRDVNKDSAIILQQEGIFRTNCLDCLDRTNLIQTMISKMALESFFAQQNAAPSPDFWMRHSTLWADNGDTLSKIYAGTGALKSSFTRHGKMSLAGAFADARKSATRLYVNNFTDKERQNTIDMLLGSLTGQSPVNLFDPVNDYVTAELDRRSGEYSSFRKIRILAGTFNLNGRSHGASEDLSPWLLPRLVSSGEDPELIAVGFQEIVELSPQQIMSTDPRTRMIWEEAVKRTLNEHCKRKGTGRYVVLRTCQLVGAALFVFAKVDALHLIKNVEASVKKTGLSGMGGNKGGCAIRLEFSNTKICFVTAHLAAGFANYEERNRDYATINSGLRFLRNRSIDDHDTVIWLGDFNYRIDLTNERVRELIRIGDINALYEDDQLNLQMVAGLAFRFYSESRITFLPTYKYDNGTDTYDTSEKARVPAWCDRVVYKGKNIRALEYNTAPLRFSDHRPVYAIFDCSIRTVDERLKQQLSAKIYESRRKAVAKSGSDLRPGDTDEDEELLGFDPISPSLPPASSDRRKWWLDNGLPARSEVKPPEGHVPNPQRNPNPFSTTPESDWIHVRHLDATIYNDADQASNKPRSTHQSSSREFARRPAVSPSGTATGSNGQPSLLDLPNDDEPMSLNPPNTSDRPKRAPPVPAKPAALTGDGKGSISTSPARDVSVPPVRGHPHQDSRDMYRPPLPARRTTNGETEIISSWKGNVPPPVRPRGAKPQQNVLDAVPSLPPRTATSPSSINTTSASGLLDNDIDENLASWKPLKPQS